MPMGKGTYGNKVGRPAKMVRGKTIATQTGQYFKPVKGGIKAGVVRGVKTVLHIGSFLLPGTKAIKGAKAAHRAYNAAARTLGSGTKNKLSSARSALTNIFGGKIQ
jgi:hypothetical protein